MKAFYLLGVTFFVTGATAFASVNTSEILSDGKQGVRGGIYKSTASIDVDPEMVAKDGQLFTNLDIYHLSQNEAVAVFPTSEGLISVIYQPSDDEAGKEANQLLLTPEQFAQLNLKFDKNGGPEQLQDYPNFDILNVAKNGKGHTRGELRPRRHRVPENQGFSLFGNGSGWGGFGEAATGVYEGAKKYGGKYGGCVLAVARRFGSIGKSGNGVGMVDAYRTRQPHLWMDASPSTAIPGKTICSYRGGPRGKGDVATYVGNGRWEYRTSGKTHPTEMSGFSIKNCITHI